MNSNLRDDLSQRFAAHATIYAGTTPDNASPLYAHLSQYISTDTDILVLVRDADRATQVSNLLFGAVHYLLLRGEAHPLRTFYASLTTHPDTPRHAAPAFRDFCLHHAQAIYDLVTTRRVQTNEVQRCTGLAPAFLHVYQSTYETPLALVEIGSSAGLHLLWDRYHYTYESIDTFGNPSSTVQLHCTLLGTTYPPLQSMPVIQSRIGIDINPIDVMDTDAIRWVRALIWPEHRDRAELFAHAVAIAQDDPPRILAGNAADMLHTAIDTIPANVPLCIFHSYTLNQCPEQVRDHIIRTIEALASTRPVFRISLEWYGGQQQPHLELFTYTSQGSQHDLLAYCESHGRSLTWLQQQKAG